MSFVFGCMDNTFIPINAPENQTNLFTDRNGNQSINALFICSSNKKFYEVDVSQPGSVNDNDVFLKTSLFWNLRSGWRPFKNPVLLGDSNYASSEFLLTPIREPKNRGEIFFNKEHKKKRRLISEALYLFKVSFFLLTIHCE